MNTPLSSQILHDQLDRARSYLHAAAETRDISLAKFALGLLTGAVTAGAPVEDHYRLYELGHEGQAMENIERVLDAADLLTRRGYSYVERLQYIEREANHG